MILTFRSRGFCLWADVSFADLKTQFICEILGQVAHLPVLEGHIQVQTIKRVFYAKHDPTLT